MSSTSRMASVGTSSHPLVAYCFVLLSAVVSLRFVTRLLLVQISQLLSVHESIFVAFVPSLTTGIFVGLFYDFRASLRFSGVILFLPQYGTVMVFFRSICPDIPCRVPPWALLGEGAMSPFCTWVLPNTSQVSIIPPTNIIHFYFRYSVLEFPFGSFSW